MAPTGPPNTAPTMDVVKNAPACFASVCSPATAACVPRAVTLIFSLCCPHSVCCLLFVMSCLLSVIKQHKSGFTMDQKRLFDEEL